ncbi:bifunctional metallophosphatase/5'-nucleotidase [Ferrimonas sp. YFM]|uniref:bifunctional metallophosphatase/5'-nucleotidase n=1 Tax=Ferrimonas sp. YFM TaxID=3028878 RepID=UPI002574237B|nr:bifunctional metallophosphatase/5'-nucleotidase [Ferrimonas sp. YFM]
MRIDSGVDTDRNGTLDSGEINSTSYLCEEDGFWLQLLHFADIDGNEATALDTVDEFSALVDGFRNDERYGLDTLVLSSGDNVIAGPRWFAAENSDVRAITGSNEPGHVDHLWMNEFGVAATALGNHDLDQGPGELVDATSSESKNGVTFPGTQFPYLAANVDFSADEDFTDIIGQDGEDASLLGGKFAGSAIVRLGGERVGIVGASTPDLPNITSTGDLTIAGSTSEIAELAAALQPTIDALTDAGIDKIVVVAHMQQISIEKALAGALKNVDIIVAGGSNTRMGDSTDTLFPGDTEFAEDYPFQTTDADGNPTLVVNVDGDYKYLGRLVVAFDKAGHVIPSLLDKNLNGSWASTEENVNLVDGVRNARVIETRDALQGVISSQFNNVIGHTDVYLEGRRGEVRTQETNLGNLTSDAMIAYAEQCTELTNVLALRNGGGIRAEIGNAVTTGLTTEFFPPFNDGLETAKPGDVSEGHMRSTLRFDNGLVVVDVTGAQLKALLEHGVAATAAGATPGQFPQVGGISFGFDPALEAGSRITDLWVDTDDNNIPDTALYTAGEAQAAAADTYQVVTLNFLANGGDQYPFADQSTNRRQLYSSVGFGDPDADDNDLPDFPVLTSCDNGAQSDFSYTGGEQDAVAEYFLANYADAANGFDIADTAPADDRRIQNLSVISEFVAPVTP